MSINSYKILITILTMHLKPKSIAFLLIVIAEQIAISAAEMEQARLGSADKIEVFKTTATRDLVVNLFWGRSDSVTNRPAIMFFFGGGWVKGSPQHFERQARFFSQRGFTVLLPDYRTAIRDGTQANEAADDAADAYNWLIKNTGRLQIEPTSIILAGGSAGGYLALSIPLLNPDLPLPAALVAYNPVTKTTPGGFYKPKLFRAPADTGKYSLEDKLRGGLPPLLVLHGEADTTVPYANSREFVAIWQSFGNKAKLVSYPSCDHGFFNTSPSYEKTLEDTVGFCQTIPNLNPCR
jgi:acetyl esterase/lipase